MVYWYAGYTGSKLVCVCGRVGGLLATRRSQLQDWSAMVKQVGGWVKVC